MYIFDPSDSTIHSSNYYSVAAKFLHTYFRVLTDFRPKETSFDLKVSLGFSFK